MEGLDREVASDFAGGAEEEGRFGESEDQLPRFMLKSLFRLVSRNDECLLITISLSDAMMGPI